jgi:aspartyl/asparaginyl beta-hydroxylase (cupin superfamily)
VTLQQDDPRLALVRDTNAAFRRHAGPLRMHGFRTLQGLLSAPRLLGQAGRGRRPLQMAPEFQIPWLPPWRGLTAKPVHDNRDFAWTKLVREAAPAIRAELNAVRTAFQGARYDSGLNPKPWMTYYFYLEGRPVAEHLAACPKTAAVLSQLPHNSFHVCFSAIEPGGSLHAHTGPTNASLTCHLGLIDCAGARLWVGDTVVDYRDDEVFVFDDSYVHWVEHAGPRTRYTLMITFWHPELSWPERACMGRLVRFAPH